MSRARIRTAVLTAVLLACCTGLANRVVLRPFFGPGAVGDAAAVAEVSRAAMGANVIGAKYLVE